MCAALSAKPINVFIQFSSLTMSKGHRQQLPTSGRGVRYSPTTASDVLALSEPATFEASHTYTPWSPMDTALMVRLQSRPTLARPTGIGPSTRLHKTWERDDEGCSNAFLFEQCYLFHISWRKEL